MSVDALRPFRWLLLDYSWETSSPPQYRCNGNDMDDVEVGLSEEWLEYERTHGRFYLRGSVREMREQVSLFVNAHRTYLASLKRYKFTGQIRDVKIGKVTVRVYQPEALAVSTWTTLPLCLYTHAAGLIAGDLDTEDALCRFIATQVPCTVVSVDYRKGPEHKWPAMLVDTLAACTWALNPANGLVTVDTRVFAMGTSTGATLSLALTNHLAQLPTRSKLQGVVALNPMTLHPDYIPKVHQGVHTSYVENDARRRVIDLECLKTFCGAIDARSRDSTLFTGLSQHLANFPATYIVTCGADPLRDDGIVMLTQLKEAGVRVRGDHYAGLPHMFWMFPDFAGCAQFNKNLLEGIRFVLDKDDAI